MATKVTFPTADGVELVGTYRATPEPRGAALFLHMMPATRASWDDFAADLLARGWSSLAIDLRGHGESVRQGSRSLDYRHFNDSDHQASAADLEASAFWLRDQTGLGFERFALAGASIGANLALDFAARHPEVRSVLALSPGLNYRGVTPENALPNYRPGLRVMLAASEEDAYSFSSIGELAKVATPAAVELRKLQAAGHGTTMLERDPAFRAAVADWLCAA